MVRQPGDRSAGSRYAVRREAFSREERLLALFGLAAIAYGVLAIVIAVHAWQALLWPLVLRISAMASSAAVMTAHSNGMACCQPRRGYSRRACGRASP